MAWQNGARFTPDSCRPIASPNSAALGQKRRYRSLGPRVRSSFDSRRGRNREPPRSGPSQRACRGALHPI